MTAETSREAFHHGERTGSFAKAAERVMAVITERGSTGVTQDEIDAHFGMKSRRMGQRVRDLEKAGRVVKNGLRRRTRAGRMAEVWIDAGRPTGEIHVPGSVYRDGKWVKT